MGPLRKFLFRLLVVRKSSSNHVHRQWATVQAAWIVILLFLLPAVAGVFSWLLEVVLPINKALNIALSIMGACLLFVMFKPALIETLDTPQNRARMPLLLLFAALVLLTFLLALFGVCIPGKFGVFYDLIH